MAAARRASSLATVATLLAGCAAAVPGYVPPTDRPNLLQRHKAFESGDMSANTYKPSEAERALDCRKLTGSMKVIITRLTSVQQRPSPSAMASTMQKAMAATVGGTTAGADIDAEAVRERARLVAYNQLLAEKQCKTLDLDAELKVKP